MWDKLKKKNKIIYALAPMAGYTDSAFRQVCKEFGADVVYSELASAAALCYAPKKTLELLAFSKKERPYVAQLFGSEPKHFEKAVKVVGKGIKPDGIDINFGCPVPKVAKQKAGAELFKDLKQSREVIKAVIGSTDLPVSIKTRSKVGAVDVLQFLDNMKGLDIKAVMIHGRTLKQGFSGPIDCEVIKKARNYFNGIILANGGVYTHDDAMRILDKTRADGLGIGQGALGRPWIFKAIRTSQNVKRAPRAVFKVALKHAELVEKLRGMAVIIEMRKHLCWYVQGLPGAKKMREELVKVENLEDIRKVLVSKN